MNQLSLEQALDIVHPWLGTWRVGQECHNDGAVGPHDIPMPPATDELAMQTVTKAQWPVHFYPIYNGGWEVVMRTDIGEFRASQPKLRDAIIISAAMCLQSLQEKP